MIATYLPVYKSRKHYCLIYKNNKFEYIPQVLRVSFNSNSNFRNICIPYRALLVYFSNRHQLNITFRHRDSITYRGGDLKADQILKNRFPFAKMRKMLLLFRFFISIKYIMCYYVKYKQSYSYTQLCNYRVNL